MVTTTALGNNTLRLYSVVIPRPVTLTRIGAEVTAAGDAGSVMRLGIYADDGNAMPAALVLDAGTIPGDLAQVAELVINQPLSPGTYWFGGVIQGAPVTVPTVRAMQPPAVDDAVGIGSTVMPSSNVTILGRSSAGVAGALPAAFVDSGSIGAAPRIFVKVA